MLAYVYVVQGADSQLLRLIILFENIFEDVPYCLYCFKPSRMAVCQSGQSSLVHSLATLLRNNGELSLRFLTNVQIIYILFLSETCSNSN